MLKPMADRNEIGLDNICGSSVHGGTHCRRWDGRTNRWGPGNDARQRSAQRRSCGRPFQALRALVGKDDADVWRGFIRYGQDIDRITRRNEEHRGGRTKTGAMRTVLNGGMLAIVARRGRVSRCVVLTGDLVNQRRLARTIFQVRRHPRMAAAAIARIAPRERHAEPVDRKGQRQQQEHCAPDQRSHAMKSGERQVDDDFPACLAIAPACRRDRLTWINDQTRDLMQAVKAWLIDFRSLTNL